VKHTSDLLLDTTLANIKTSISISRFEIPDRLAARDLAWFFGIQSIYGLIAVLLKYVRRSSDSTPPDVTVLRADIMTLKAEIKHGIALIIKGDDV